MKWNKWAGMASLLFLMNAPVFSQSEATPATAAVDSSFRATKTLLGSGHTKLRYLGMAISPEYQYTGIGKGNGSVMGNAFSVILNRRWSFGVAGFMSERRFDPQLSDNNALLMRFTAGGGLFEFTPRPYKVLHLSFPLFLGEGRVRLDSFLYSRNGDGRNGNVHGHFFLNNTRRETAEFWVVQPGVRMEVNVARFARLYAGAAYRIAAGPLSLSYPNATGGTSALGLADLSGLTVQAGVKIGFFEYRLDRLHARKPWGKRRATKN